MKHRYLLLLLCCCIACKKETQTTTVHSKAYLLHSSISYAGASPLQIADVYLPDSGQAQHSKIIICIHGGGWNAGQKEDFNTFGLFELFTRNGYAVVNMNYRLAPKFLYPAPLDDIDSLINFLGTKAVAWHLDTGNICLLGKSAGAHFALLYAYARNSHKKIKMAIDAFGPADITHPTVLTDHIYTDLTRFLGADYTQNPSLWKQASPVSYINSAVPTIIMQGSADTTVYPVQAQLLVDSLGSRGIPLLYYTWPLANHYWDLISWNADTSLTLSWMKNNFH